MNENLNLVEILKDCPKGTKLYSTVWGDVKFNSVSMDILRPINVEIDGGIIACIANDGKLDPGFDGECTLFPSKEVRTWDSFQPKKPKFDPKTLQPYMKVLVRDTNESLWRCAFYSHKREDEDNPYKYVATSSFCSVFCIPYNEETKHLVGTTEQAPEYYRYWED